MDVNTGLDSTKRNLALPHSPAYYIRRRVITVPVGILKPKRDEPYLDYMAHLQRMGLDK